MQKEGMAIPASGRHLVEREELLFAREYEAHFLAGETKPRAIGEPYLLASEGAKRGVLLIHGLLAAPEEVRQWADFLHGLGLTVYAPRLAGHGTSAVDLAPRVYSDWVASVDRGAAILKTCCERIVVAGFSTGAGLALHQALIKPGEFAAVISVSAPLRFKSLAVCFVEILDAWNRCLRSLGLGRLTREFVVNDADNPHINYARCPVRSLVEVKALMRQVYRRLPSLTIPALILQGDRDPKVAGSSGRRLFDRIASPRKAYREIPFHLHGIVRGEVARQVFRETETFLRDLN